MDGRILLVDDEKDILDLLEEVLRRDGFREIRRRKTGPGLSGPAGNFCPTLWCWISCFPTWTGWRSANRFGNFPIARFCSCPQKTTILIRFSAFPAAATITSQNLSAPGRWCSA